MSPSHSMFYQVIRDYYTEKVQQRETCCSGISCCSSAESGPQWAFDQLPAEKQPLSFGCGDPLSLAELQDGQIVLDLGSGTGYDCFLAAKHVGESGKVFGVDMTPQMIRQATQSANRLGLTNVTFLLGYLESLPLPSNCVDVIISNCVVNLSPQKQHILREAYRVLKPGGKLAITDMLSLQEVPPSLQKDAEVWAACLSGAITKDEWYKILLTVGFQGIEITFSNPPSANPNKNLKVLEEREMRLEDLYSLVVSARIRATKG